MATPSAKNIELQHVSVGDVTIHIKKPESTRPQDRKQANKIVKDILNPDSKLDFSVLPHLDDLQIAQIIKELSPQDLPMILRKFRNVVNKRNKKLRTNLSFRNISYKKGEDIYLSGVSGYVKKNTISCVLGAPDSGITTLMKTIAGRAPRDAKVTGEVFLDGQPVDEGYAQHLGFISKNDIHYPTLTVRETLRMSARMRVGELEDIYHKLKVELVMKFFGLDGNIANTIVGDEQIRGISGGQKRRVSVAAEIVAGHSVILADLLTNGLDSKTSYDLVKLMQTVAHTKTEQIASMISLVQPAPELFDLFDYLLLMSKGRSIYFGPLHHNGRYPVIDFLESLGFYRPPAKSIPGFLAEVSFDPVRFHITRLSAQMRKSLSLPPPSSSNPAEGGPHNVTTTTRQTDKPTGEDVDPEDCKDALPGQPTVALDPLYRAGALAARMSVQSYLKTALENKVDEPAALSFKDHSTDMPLPRIPSSFGSHSHDRKASTAGEGTGAVCKGERTIASGDANECAKAAVPMPLENAKQEVKTPSIPLPPAQSLPHQAAPETYEEVVGIRLRRQQQGQGGDARDGVEKDGSAGSVVVSTRDNEKEIGFAYLLTSYKQSKIYYDLGLKLWTEFEPRMPWEKSGPQADKFSTSLAYQTFECLKREWIVRTRDRTTLLGNFAERIIVALVLGTVFLDLGTKQKDADARVGLFFIILLNFSMGASAQIPAIMAKRKVYYSQEAAGYYHGYAFFLAQQLIFIPFVFCELVVFLTITYALSDLQGEPLASAEFWNCFSLVFLCVVIARTWALFLCGVAPNTTAAVALFPVTVVLKVLVCGYMIAPDDIPSYWKWLNTISFLTYAFRGLLVNEFYDLRLQCDNSELEPSTSDPLFNVPPPNGYGGAQACPFTTGRMYLTRYDMEDYGKGEVVQCILYLFCFFLVYHALALVALVFKPHELGDQEEAPKFDFVANPSHAGDDGVGAEHHEAKKGPVSFIEWRKLSYEVSNRKRPGEKITLLDSVEGYARPGDMVALMGPSGAGKSTLLDVIAGKKTSGWVSGTRLVNGKGFDASFFPRVAGYVEQFDTHVERATVFESVYFSAQLRLGVTDDQALAEAEHAMKSVRIWHARDRLIGNIETGGISPELRKKTAIAVEVVAHPTILFLDEPTTGLDSVSAMAVIDTVTDLARGRGLAVVCTIHQPSAELFTRFGRILILQPTATGGRVSYFGDVGRVVEYCHHHGLGEMKEGRNIADFAMEALGSTHADGREPADVFLTSEECKTMRSELEAGVFNSAGEVRVPEFDRAYARGVGKQFQVLLKRSVLCVVRDKNTLLAQLNSALLIGLFVGSLYWDLGYNQSEAMQRVSLSFFVIVFVFFTAAYKIPLLVGARASSFREKTSNMYKGWVLYLTQMLADLIIVLPRATMLSVLIYFMCGLNLADDGTRFAAYLFMMILTFFLAIGIAEFFAFVCPNERLGQVYFTSCMTVFVLFAGFLIRKDNIPDWWIWLFYGNAVRYPLNFFLKNELDGLDFSCPGNEGAVPVKLQASYFDPSLSATVTCDASQMNNLNCFRYACPITSGNDVLSEYGVDQSVAAYAGIVIAIAVVLRVVNIVAFTKLNWVQK
uniref:ABC transporter domain-containing protein n=1 Tax=Lotharella globosa TaxID=91324 RepID=A0A7S3YEH2_9EUKA